MGNGKKARGAVRRQYGVMPFVLEEVEGEGVLTAHAGLTAVVEAARGMGLPAVVGREVSVKLRERGYTEWEFVESLLCLVAAGGEHVDDLGTLAADGGVSVLLGHGIPSAAAAKKFLYAFHGEPEPAGAGPSLFPSDGSWESAPLAALGRVNEHVVRQVQASRPERVATLDHDGTIVESTKRVAATTYEGTRGYQPSVVLWAEQDQIVADEFRAGNVPAGSGVLRMVQRAFAALPKGVEQVNYRADSASYEHELLNWLREEDERTGRPRAIFAIRADMSVELKARVLAVSEWHPDPEDRHRSWGEVDFVPSGPSVKKGRKPDRYLAVRITPRQGELFADGSEVKYFAVVTNDWERDGLALLQWHREKAGTVEHTHDILKNELAGGVLPCERFGANAAWWRLNVLTYNLLSVLRRVALPPELERARPKRLRFLVFAKAGELIRHARSLLVRVVGRFADALVRLTDIRRRLWQQTPVWQAGG